jgi:hypothetical protein
MRSALDGYTDDWLRGDSAPPTPSSRARAARRPAPAASNWWPRRSWCAARARGGARLRLPGYAALPRTPRRPSGYAAYLQGRWQGLDVGLLPEQHRGVVTGGTLAGVQDPLARLVAAGALMKAGRIAPADIANAVETASNQGWRRPLLAWLGVQEQRARWWPLFPVVGIGASAGGLPALLRLFENMPAE